MCGIFGEFLYQGSVSLEASINRLDLIKHRGPDGFGFEFGNYTKGTRAVSYNCAHDNIQGSEAGDINYFFGHRRLSIIDRKSVV